MRHRLHDEGIFKIRPSLKKEINYYEDYIEKQSNAPIVLAYIQPINFFYVIDGNHRYNAAIAKGDKTIQGVVLHPKEHLKYMTNELSRNLYIIHHNTSIIHNFSTSIENKISFELSGTDFYPLSEINHDVSLWRILLLKTIIRPICKFRTNLYNKFRRSQPL